MPRRAWDSQDEERRFEAEMNRMLDVPVITAVHSDSWLRKLDTAIAVAERHHWFKQAKRLNALRDAIGIARGVRRL